MPYELNTIKDMLQTMYNLADAINEVTEETGKTTRYGDPQVIASDLEKYVYGTVAYVQEELAAKGLEEKTVAVVTYVNEDGTYTVADSLQTADLQSGTGRLSAWRNMSCASPRA